jgi:polysaccharide chain length determinant protein (PEP-CTERM system associated)
MKSLHDLQLADYLEILRRRIVWVLGSGIVMGVATYLYVSTLPDIYTSETVILVEPQKVPSDYVRPTSTGTIESRLATISQQIMSRTRLEKIIQENSLYLDVRMKRPIETVVEMMRQDIELTVTKSDAFTLSYQSKDPAVAQKITNQLASLYIEENLKVREEQTEGVSQFLELQLKETKAKLLGLEARLSGFKMNHMGSLPEQQQANLAVLGRLQQQLQASIDSTNRLEEQKSYQQRLHAELKSFKSLVPPGNVEAAVALGTVQKPPSPLSQKKAELNTLLQRYTTEHPDVRKLKAEVAVLEQQQEEVLEVNEEILPEKSTVDTHPPQTSPEAIHLKRQIDALNQQIRQGVKEQERIRTEMAVYQARLDNIPRIEQMQKEITRDYDITREHYQRLLAKKNDAEMAGNLEKRQKGEQFRIIDPASFPQKPIKPDRLKLNAFGVLAGLCLGFGLALLLELNDESIRSTQQLTRLTEYPVLAAISVISIPSEKSLRGSVSKMRRGIRGFLSRGGGL